jgi:hypothetical protein
VTSRDADGWRALGRDSDRQTPLSGDHKDPQTEKKCIPVSRRVWPLDPGGFVTAPRDWTQLSSIEDTALRTGGFVTAPGQWAQLSSIEDTAL